MDEFYTSHSGPFGEAEQPGDISQTDRADEDKSTARYQLTHPFSGLRAPWKVHNGEITSQQIKDILDFYGIRHDLIDWDKQYETMTELGKANAVMWGGLTKNLSFLVTLGAKKSKVGKKRKMEQDLQSWGMDGYKLCMPKLYHKGDEKKAKRFARGLESGLRPVMEKTAEEDGTRLYQVPLWDQVGKTDVLVLLTPDRKTAEELWHVLQKNPIDKATIYENLLLD